MRDEEYESLYRNILPELDLILWVIKADDRAFSIDERFYRRVMADYQHPLLFVVNQADKIESCHEWDTTSNTPSPNQSANIDARKESIRHLFSPFIRDNPGKDTCDDAYFTIRYFRKSTAHLTFKRPELVERMNDIMAKHYPGMLAAR